MNYVSECSAAAAVEPTLTVIGFVMTAGPPNGPAVSTCNGIRLYFDVSKHNQCLVGD